MAPNARHEFLDEEGQPIELEPYKPYTVVSTKVEWFPNTDPEDDSTDEYRFWHRVR